ncbi:LacI family DNA-binding transcriptional regulator [Brachybacterium subflavum]|uniref:LacI family DNA-binding transcriptional regulator n=1 Tax=Brachybacterium subflavum TaxID=2585206 RepID=UPI0012663FA9|nr:LacI family DNA-binding transcriptional regulator [Brachybacterium subflavum]
MNRNRPATIRDVAERAGVSTKTVSRVMNRDGYVADGTRTRVLTAIAALSYRPNPAAQSLRRASSRSIAVVVEDISEPFAAQVTLAVEHAVDDGTVVIVSSSLGDPVREAEILATLAARQIDGVVLAPTRTPRPRLLRWMGRTAVVCVDRPLPGERTDVVLSDNARGMQDAVEHLLAQGHRRIAYVGDAPEVFAEAERLQGYRAALARHGVTEDHALIYERRPDAERTRQHLAWLAQLPHPPTAFVSGNSLSTLAMIRAGFDAGADSFIAFDDFPLAEVVCGGVNVVAQDAAALGTEATHTLLRRIANDDAPVKESRIATQLILR